MDNSNVVIVSSSQSSDPKDIVKLMLGELPSSIEKPGITLYPWHINTKYYNVDVNLCCLERKELQSKGFSEKVEGLVIYFDSSVSDSLNSIEAWMPFLKEFNAEVKILVCQKCCDEGVSLTKGHEWCIKNKFELVELDGVSEDEDFPETVGVARIRQALEAHVWPDLTLKDQRESSRQIDPSGLAEFLGDSLEEDTDGLDFNFLFSKLVSMKEKAANLPSDERKKFAEKVVTAYWHAIEGDSDELSDDSSSSDLLYDKL